MGKERLKQVRTFKGVWLAQDQSHFQFRAPFTDLFVCHVWQSASPEQSTSCRENIFCGSILPARRESDTFPAARRGRQELFRGRTFLPGQKKRGKTEEKFPRKAEATGLDKTFISNAFGNRFNAFQSRLNAFSFFPYSPFLSGRSHNYLSYDCVRRKENATLNLTH